MKSKKILKIFITSLITISILLANITITFCLPSDWPYYDGEITSKAAFVMDSNSSKVLYTLNPDTRLYPASLTKIMTAIVVFDYVNGNYDDLVTFSYNAVTKDIDKNSVTIGASAGDQLSVKDCLYSLLLPSANDAANALAEYVAGSINDFTLLMNEKAEDLGLKNTHFVNPSGLHDDNQYTSASDMAKILQYAMQYPIFLQISSSISYRHAPIRKYKNPENSNNQVLNTNSIMVPGSGYYYNSITSGKTGHTSLAGYNLAASAKKNDMSLICVVLGSSKDKIRYDETKALFNFYFDKYKSLNISNMDSRFSDSLNTVSINDVELIESLNITCSENSYVTLPKDADESNIESKISYQVNDIYNKYAIGSISYYYGDEFIGKCTIEGRNADNSESIYTSHLNLSSPLSMDIVDDQNVVIDTPNRTNALIYKNSNGNLVISKTLTTMLIVIFGLLFIVLIILFFFTQVIGNVDIPFRKMIFRIRRRLK